MRLDKYPLVGQGDSYGSLTAWLGAHGTGGAVILAGTGPKTAATHRF